MRNFDDLTEREILALTISSEEEDAHIYADFSDGLHEITRRPPKCSTRWRRRRTRTDAGSSISSCRNSASTFRSCAANQFATGLEHEVLTDSVRNDEAENARRRFVLQVIQPGLVGLMDGSVSTLAPVFAAAFATHNSWNAFLVGLAASIGAGISMGFAEALSDDGKLSGRGAPLLRGLVCGLMTTAGGIGHTLPFLIPYFYTATAIAFIVVVIELIIIAWIQWRYMEAPPLTAAAKVMIGGALVLAAGILIGSS